MIDAAPKRIWMTHEDHGASWSGSYRAFRCSDLDHSSDDGPNPEYPEYILASEHAALIREAEARGMERAVHVMPHYFAVYSVTGVHIGVWEDGQIAGDVLAEYAGGSIVEMVPISAIRAEAAAIRRAAEGTGT